MPSPVRALLVLTALAGLSLGAAGVRPASLKDLPVKFRQAPFSLMSLSVGRPNRGFQVRAKRLRETDFLEIKKGSGSRAYGHPSLVLMLDRSSRQVAQASRPRMKMLVGDLSHEHGGPLDG